MMTIPARVLDTSDGSLVVPMLPIPADAIAIVCDGSEYTIYQPGDKLPDSGE